MTNNHPGPLSIVRDLRLLAGAGPIDQQVAAEIARDLELWSVEHRHQLEDASPRATPTNLRTLALALDNALLYFKHKDQTRGIIKSTADELRLMATSLQRSLAP